jgi:Rne/Rng family ribonuclease
MTKELLVSSSPHETKVAVLEDDQLVEVYFQRDTDVGLVGGIYKGRVNRVLPGMQSAFVDIGLERDAFLYVSDFFEDSEEYDRVFTEAENRADKLSEAGSAVETAAAVQSQPETEPKPESTIGATPQAAVSEAPSTAASEPPPSANNGAASTETAGASTANSTAPPVSERTFSPIRPHEYSGRRSRRRGRRSREFRYGKRETSRPAEEKHEPGQGIELLPGESLAKYSRALEESSASMERPSPEPANQVGAGAPPENTATPQATDKVVEPISVESLAEGDLQIREEAFTPSLSEGAAPGEFRTPPPPAKEEAEGKAENFAEAQLQVGNKGTEQDEAAAESDVDRETCPEPVRTTETESDLFSESRTETAAEVENLETARAGQEPDQDRAETVVAASTEQIPEPAVGPEAVSQSADVAARESYTLREPTHRARVAPRNNRRGRGRFRGQPGRRREPGFTRGPEPARAGNHHPTPITELLKEGQEILVQIAKEPLGAKGARITSHIALPGRYLVYMPTITHIGVSRKIGSDEERLRLRNIILESRGSLPGGFIVRTAAAGHSDEEIKADVAFLANLWNDIRSKADRIKAPALLHRDLTLVERILRDLLSPDFRSLWVDSEIEYEHILDFVNHFQPSLIGHVKLYTRDTPLFEEFGVQTEIDSALKPKVWLKSGGYIVINQTEALVAIDVNTGKYVGKTNRLEDTIVKINIDAVKEIVRQIRLRDLGGIVVIDFIDMDERRNRAKVVQALDEALRHDRAPTKILSFNEFGLVALTRKRVKHSLERTLCDPCPYCNGAGWVKSVTTVSYDIVSESRKMASQVEGNTLHLRVNPEVAATLKARDGVLISEIESATRKDVVIKADASVHQEQFEIY